MRKLLLLSVILLFGLAFIARLYYLQVHNRDEYSLYDDNAIRKVYDYPKRGYVYDRHGKLLVANQPSYDIMFIPREVKDIDTLELCTLLKITKDDFIKFYNKAYNYSPRLPSVFIPQLSRIEYASIQEKIRKFEGFYVQKRSLRDYQTSIGANVLGDIGEVNDFIIERNPYYKMGDLIGKQGVELSYEEILRGIKGIKFIQKDIFNRDIGPYKEGVYDTLAQPGKDITITIDASLQKYGELLMKNKHGGIVAIEPSTGEILAMVSAPTYNPNLLVGRQRSANFTKLYNDSINKPLFDRGLQAMYPPGSPFKLLTALAGMQEGVVTPADYFACNNGYSYGGRRMGCHHHASPVNLNSGIYNSCNAYFANVYRRSIDKFSKPSKGMDVWSDHIKSFGLGNYLNNDLAVGQPGKIPNSQVYDQVYGKNRWGSTFNLSNSIGQGEILVTPIQLANMTATIANRGFYYTPHIIKSIEDGTVDEKYLTPNYTTVEKRHFEPVVEGMFDTYNKGTASALRVPGIDICGKTGTAENFLKVNGKRTQLTDHSIFIAFAPKDNPKIAVAVFVENGYWGSRFAGRIASLMIEKHILGDVTLRKDMETWILTHGLESEYAKPYSGKPFSINRGSIIDQVPLETED